MPFALVCETAQGRQQFEIANSRIYVQGYLCDVSLEVGTQLQVNWLPSLFPYIKKIEISF